jgi:2-iminoacetate synthase
MHLLLFFHNHFDDKTFVQFLLAFRLFMPKIGLNLSTREKQEFRDKVLPLGITKFSAGSKTGVGAYTSEDKSTDQFEISISDKRSVEEIVKALNGKDIIFKDWERIV